MWCMSSAKMMCQQWTMEGDHTEVNLQKHGLVSPAGPAKMHLDGRGVNTTREAGQRGELCWTCFPRKASGLQRLQGTEEVIRTAVLSFFSLVWQNTWQEQLQRVCFWLVVGRHTVYHGGKVGGGSMSSWAYCILGQKERDGSCCSVHFLLCIQSGIPAHATATHKKGTAPQVNHLIDTPRGVCQWWF